MEDPNVAPEPAPCQVCAAALLSPKKYQIHKIEDGYALGGKPFVLMQLPPGTEGHACHKCYQANMKARKRANPDEHAIDGMATPAKKPIRKLEPLRPAVPPDHAVIGFKALMNLASLVTSSCRDCHGQWMHISQQLFSPDHVELTFTCQHNHAAKWSSLNNEIVPLEHSDPLGDHHGVDSDEPFAPPQV